MKVNVELSKEFSPPHVTIYADVITDEIQRVIDLLDSNDIPLIVQRENQMIVLKAEDIYDTCGGWRYCYLYRKREILFPKTFV
ncbi:MAG: hypothetical protein SPI63_05565 [Bulleidia sp.]|nr:hypothetical protein [Bulleidia sp.]